MLLWARAETIAKGLYDALRDSPILSWPFVYSVALLGISVLLILAMSPKPISQQRSELIKCREELRTLLESSLSHPLLLRLAWSDAATYDESVIQWPFCGGANGSITSDRELSDPCNAGLSKAVDLLKDIKSKHPAVSWADLIQMAGALAVELTGGPVIDLIYGREDAAACISNFEQKAGNLPSFQHPFPDGAPSAETHIRNTFYRMGFTNREIVALCGAHTIGRAFKDRSGACPNPSGDIGATTYTKLTSRVRCANLEGGVNIPGGMSWTEKWMCFDNSYFNRASKLNNIELLWLPTDKALSESPEFKPFFQKYAEDQSLFFSDYARAHKKMSELGARFSTPGGISLS